MLSCDGEHWGSGFGPELDVMAPGVLIPTTDIIGNIGYNPDMPIHLKNTSVNNRKINSDFPNQDYTVWFNGTSAACPHVAGVAALILSVNPNLTGKQVHDIIESTTQKVRPDLYDYDIYDYDFYSDGWVNEIPTDRPNGTWNWEVGHGLVDAYTAVFAAQCAGNSLFAPRVITQNTIWNTSVYVMHSITIPSDVTLTITNIVQFSPNTQITIQPGGKLIIDGGTLANTCENQMWQGITILSDGNNQGSVEINNGIIENATTGITANAGSMVVANNAHFVNNKLGIKFDPLATSGTLTNTTFELNSSYMGNPNFEAHLKMESCGQVSINGCTFSSHIPLNQGKGIVISNAPTKWSGNNKLLSVPVDILSEGTLTHTGTIESNGNVKITVHPNGKLVVNGGTLTNAVAGTMWQGIYVSGNESMPQTDQEQGVLELNGAVIENARNAIATYNLKPNGDIDYYTTGGIIRANNTTFKNNKRSVEFLAYLEQTDNQILPNVSYFKNCTFVVDDNNLFADNGTSFDAHITMWKVLGVRIIDCIFENNSTNVAIAKRGQAIGTIDAGYTVDQYCILDPSQPCEKCKESSDHSFFRGFTRAIESSYSGAQYAIKIDRSVFQNNITGIFLSGEKNPQVSRLKMSLSTANCNSPIGIHLNMCTQYKIEDNEISSDGNGYSTGILVQRVGFREETIYRNEIFKTRYGIRTTEKGVRGLNYSPTDLAIPYVGLQFNCNDFSNNDFDIYVPFTRAVHGSISSGADNLFSYPGTNHFITEKDWLVKYYYDTSNPGKEPAHRSSNIDLYHATANPCESSFCAPIVHEGNPPDLVLGTYNKLNQEYAGMLDVFYEKGYDEVLIDYYNGIINNAKLLEAALAYLEDILAVTEQMAALSNEALLYLKTDSIVDLAQIRDWYDAMPSLSAKYSLAETYKQLGKLGKAVEILDSIPAMFHLNVNDLIEHNNYVALFNFKNEIQGSGRTIAELTEGEVDILLSFAEASDGWSSIIAQNILGFFYEIWLEKEDCIKPPNREDEDEFEDEVVDGIVDEARSEGGDGGATAAKRGRDSLKNITIHPNPTTGKLKIENGELKIENVEIFDVYGRKLQSKIVNLQSKIVIDIAHLTAGIYFVKISTDVGEVVKKVVKQ